MTAEVSITKLAQAIQLALGPAFLLTGVGAVLSVFTTRLGRIVDRARILHGRLMDDETLQGGDVHAELALLVCVVVAVIFLGAFVSIGVRPRSPGVSSAPWGA